MNDNFKMWFARALLYLKPYKRFSKDFKYTFGIHKDEPDPRDYVVSFPIGEKTESHILPINPYEYVKNQGNLGSCASHAIASAIEISNKINETNRKGIALSELDHYWHARVLENSYPRDAGMTSRAMLRVAQDRGLSPEKLWPYVINKFNTKPDVFADMFSSLFKIKYYFRVASIEDAELALKYNLPVLIGVRCNKSFLLKIGDITYTKGEDLYGGHEFVLYGYNSTNKIFYGINSWGKYYKDNGTMLIPYEYVRKYLIDLWTITV